MSYKVPRTPPSDPLLASSGGSRTGERPAGGGSWTGGFVSGSWTGGFRRGGFRGGRRFEGPRGPAGGAMRERFFELR